MVNVAANGLKTKRYFPALDESDNRLRSSQWPGAKARPFRCDATTWLCSHLLDRRKQPRSAAHAHEGPRLGHLLRSALDHAAARALEHAVVDRVAHRDGCVFGVAFA